MFLSTCADVKITFNLEEGVWHGHHSETLWASPLGDGLYSLQNVPFFAHGVSRFDLVSAFKKEDSLVFDSVISRSGHSTVRVVATGEENIRALDMLVGVLRSKGCAAEHGNVADVKLFAVDVPGEISLDEVIETLEGARIKGGIDWEMGNEAHPETE